jgi:hypothetical protein
VAGSGCREAAGGLADSAGFHAIHSQRFAVAKAPDKMLWMFRIVFAVSGLQLCGLHPARLQSWVAAARDPAGAQIRLCITRHHCGAPLAEIDESVVD